jgi:hypothetical protein
VWARGFAACHQAGPITAYLALIVVAGAVAAISAGRGTRAALAQPRCL